MSGRVTVRLTHAQADRLKLIAWQAGDSAEEPVDSAVFKRAGDAIQAALTAQEERRRARAEVRARPPDDPMLHGDDPRRPERGPDDLSPPWRDGSPW